MTIKNQQPLTRSVGVISSSWFLLRLLPSPGFKTTGDKIRRAITVNKITIPGLLINHLITLYREPANTHKTLYPDSKNHAVPSLHRDSFSAKVPGLVPGAASGNAYYHNRRAVSIQACFEPTGTNYIYLDNSVTLTDGPNANRKE